ncbi:hypothetical protein SteCoe_33462 [Stentor coeruleus]|uniref:Uncharacterized protein n=1 Tax=Stentor coeruleus TaxID=5963 RepID=A0A1R2AWQ2_9CILI|nr:hypothetical protein SteCoe_33462 [Stentor coeruleus]
MESQKDFKSLSVLPQETEKRITEDEEPIKILLCKPNGDFVEYFTYKDYPLKYTYNWALSITGYSHLKLHQRESNNKIKTLTEHNKSINELFGPENPIIIFATNL